MIYGQASTTVTVGPAAVLDFVIDVERYRRADTKIRAVVSVVPDGEDIVVCLRSRLRGLPTPPVRQRVRRTGDHRIDITDVRSWQSRFVSFHGTVTCEPSAAGTRVTHREEFHFHGLLRVPAERYLARWLADDVRAEVARMREILDGTGD